MVLVWLLLTPWNAFLLSNIRSPRYCLKFRKLVWFKALNQSDKSIGPPQIWVKEHIPVEAGAEVNIHLWAGKQELGLENGLNIFSISTRILRYDDWNSRSRFEARGKILVFVSKYETERRKFSFSPQNTRFNDANSQSCLKSWNRHLAGHLAGHCLEPPALRNYSTCWVLQNFEDICACMHAGSM